MPPITEPAASQPEPGPFQRLRTRIARAWQGLCYGRKIEFGLSFPDDYNAEIYGKHYRHMLVYLPDRTGYTKWHYVCHGINSHRLDRAIAEARARERLARRRPN